MIHYRRCAHCWGIELPEHPHVCPTLSDVSRREKAKLGAIQRDVIDGTLDTAAIALRHNVEPFRVREIARLIPSGSGRSHGLSAAQLTGHVARGR